ncbi:MAG: tetratricopeptide repeat protein, partial [Myxococcales bacterium]|nr:tetratricopeptide repeat protein [Myxococcales bacterium]
MSLGLGACKRDERVTPPDTEQPAEGDRGGEAGPGPADWEAFNPGRAGPGGALEEEPEATRPPPQPVTSRGAAFKGVAAGNFEGAAEFLTPLVERKPDDLAARRALVHARVMTGDYAGAEALLRDLKLRKLNPEDQVAARLQLARLHELRGDLPGAEQHLREALKARPDDLVAKGELLATLVTSGRRESTEAHGLMDELYDAYDGGAAKDAPALIAVAQAALARGSSGAFHDANMVLGEA